MTHTIDTNSTPGSLDAKKGNDVATPLVYAGNSDSASPVSAKSVQGPVTPEDVHSVNDFHSYKDSASINAQGEKKAGFQLGTSSIDECRPFKIVVIGAGFSGILAGIRFHQYMKNVDLTIYEKHAGVGGAWWSNRYPGLACDIPSHCYQYSFEAKTDWSAFYSPGPEILEDIERVVEKYKVMRYIKLQHELTLARYDEQSGKWHLTFRRSKTGSDEAKTVEDIADFVLLCAGSLSRPKWPDIKGLRDFKGKLMHSAEWDEEVGVPSQERVTDWKDKRVGVLGAGSSGIQIVSALQPYVGRLYNYVRGRTWLAPSFLSDKLLGLLGRESTESNYVFTDEDKERLKDPEFFRRFRHEVEVGLNSTHYQTIKGSKLSEEARKELVEHMTSRLQKKPWIADHLIPDFSVGCRRVTPGPGYLEALQEDNVDFVTTNIAKVTETGVELVDGTRHRLDVLVCATGFDTTFQYPFEVIGRAGKTLRERYTPHPETYFSVCTDGFPNWFSINGPNLGYGAGSFLPVLEAEVAYSVKVAFKIQREHLKSIEPKRGAVADFEEYLQVYLKNTVFNDKCPSWFKAGKTEGRIVGVWPGSNLHTMETLKHPRWEDYNYEYLDSKNRFYWLGDGSTYNEKYMTGDRAWYLNEVDYPPVP